MVSASPAEFVRPEIRETDLLTINYTSGTTSRPKGVMITHRNAWMNVHRHASPRAHDLCRSLSVDAADVSRQRLDFRLDRNGSGSNAHLSAQSRAARCLRIDGDRAGHDAVRGANGFNSVSKCAGKSPSPRAERNSRYYRRRAPRSQTIQRLEEELGWTITHVYGLTETAPFITICESRPEHASLDCRTCRDQSAAGR